MPTRFNASRGLARASPARDAVSRYWISSICWPMLRTGLSEVIGSWKTMAMRVPRNAAHLVRREVSADRCRENRCFAAGDRRIAGQQPHDGERQCRFARAAFADDADDLRRAAPSTVTLRSAWTGPCWVSKRIDRSRDVEDALPVIRSAAACGSSMSRRDSPRKVKPSVVMISGMPPATTIHGASRMRL